MHQAKLWWTTSPPTRSRMAVSMRLFCLRVGCIDRPEVLCQKGSPFEIACPHIIRWYTNSNMQNKYLNWFLSIGAWAFDLLSFVIVLLLQTNKPDDNLTWQLLFPFGSIPTPMVITRLSKTPLHPPCSGLSGLSAEHRFDKSFTWVWVWDFFFALLYFVANNTLLPRAIKAWQNFERWWSWYTPAPWVDFENYRPTT